MTELLTQALTAWEAKRQALRTVMLNYDKRPSSITIRTWKKALAEDRKAGNKYMRQLRKGVIQ